MNPKLYSNYINTTEMEFRRLLVNRYMVFYTINEGEKTINIARVIYNKRNYDMELSTNMLQEERTQYNAK